MILNKPFHLLPERASTIAGPVDALFWFLLLTSAALTMLVLAMVIFYGLRYRRRTEDEVPAQDPPHRWVEVGGISFLFVLFMVMFAWGADLYVDMKKPPVGALEIHVIGKQWMWKIQHPGGQREIDELHVPIGRPVKLIMTSQDVIHSFGVPAFRIKQDVLPGSYSTQWFTATKAGEYHLFCQEYCGMLHSGMVGRVVVMEPAEYENWLAGTVTDVTPQASGAKLFTSYGCAQCHGQIAPTLAGLYLTQVPLADGSTELADDNYLRESILNAPAKIVAGYAHTMPSYRGQLSEEQVNDLIAYIKSLSSSRADTPAPERVDVAAPVTRPVDQPAPTDLPNQPPARQPPGQEMRPLQGVER